MHLNLLFFVATNLVRNDRRARDHNSFWWKTKERVKEGKKERKKGDFVAARGKTSARASSSRLYVRAVRASERHQRDHHQEQERRERKARRRGRAKMGFDRNAYSA